MVGRGFHQRAAEGGQLPLFVPDRKWSPPVELPSLQGVGRIAIDIETKDPDLRARGPGFRRGAKVIGLAVGTDDGRRWYFPTGHEGGGNLDEGVVKRWAKAELGGFSGEVVGANLGYDLDGLATCWGVELPNVKAFHDVQVAEPLLDEDRFEYNLDALSRDYLGEGKDERLLSEAGAAYGFTGSAVKKNLWRFPAGLVGPYAEGDVDRPLRIIEKQLARLEGEGLMRVYDVERRLIPILVAMRRRGVRIDVPKAEALRRRMRVRLDGIVAELKRVAGPKAELGEAASLGPALEARGIHVPRTAKTNVPSITKVFLEAYKSDELVKIILEGRKVSTIISTFLDSQILGFAVGGRIHPTFNQLKNDEGGTIGRFCLSGGTPVMIPGGTKVIQDIREGDEVYCYDKDRRLTIGRVKWSGKTGLRPVIRVMFKGLYNKKPVALVMTASHPVRLTSGEYRSAGDLKTGDRVMALTRSGNSGYSLLRIFGDHRKKAQSEHRTVFMIKNGYLPDVVHHVDETRSNNGAENLEGHTRSSHQKVHMSHEEAVRRAYLGHIRSGGTAVRAMNDAKTVWSMLRAPPKEMKDRYESGQTVSRIAREMSVAKGTVKKRLRAFGIEPVPNNHHVVSIEELPGLHEVYDIEVEEHHNFIANEVCVHNSGSNPNLQFIPARDEELAPRIRGIFVPEEDEDWQRDDASQIEYRFLTHYAVGKGAEEAREAYRRDPKTDFHKMCAQMLGVDPEDKVRRKRVKNTNFCKVYGGGLPKIAVTFGCSVEEATEFVTEYDKKLPFVKETYDAAARWAQRRGYIVTILNRRQRFKFWEPRGNFDRRAVPLLKTAALEKYGSGIVRAWAFTALNKKLQISAADMLKKGMVDAWEAGVCRIIGPYLITLHDELDNSIPRTKAGDEAGRELTRIMEKAITLSIPIIVDRTRGKDWGECS